MGRHRPHLVPTASIWPSRSSGASGRCLPTVAKQNSSSNASGYHAHPAWSPKVDKIAFIKGTIPGGRIPNVSGKLTLVDAATGQERELATPHPTAGRPSWSPDGARLVCGLQEPDGGSLLHEIRLPDGAIIQLQFRPPGRLLDRGSMRPGIPRGRKFSLPLGGWVNRRSGRCPRASGRSWSSCR